MSRNLCLRGHKKASSGSVPPVTPAAHFTFDFLSNPPPVLQFLNTSTGAVSYLWEFGDGHTSTEVSPSHQYPPESAFYTITLTAFGPGGQNSISQGFDYAAP